MVLEIKIECIAAKNGGDDLLRGQGLQVSGRNSFLVAAELCRPFTRPDIFLPSPL